MEDPRLSRMYAALILSGFARFRRRVWHEAVMRSGMLTIVGLIMILLFLAFGWREHRKGHFAKLKREMKGQTVAPEPVAVLPGGQNFIKLQRSPLPGGGSPEFLSVTLLPGCGMNVLQITAFIPDKGEVNLLASPSLEEATKIFGAAGVPATANAGPTIGGAIEMPWSGKIWGAASEDGKRISTLWHGSRLELPRASGLSGRVGEGEAVGGLFWSQVSTEAKTNVMPDGGATQAIFQAGSFGGHWISKTDVTTKVQLSGRSIEMTVIAHNVGNQGEPIGIGWQPKFAIVSGDRSSATLRLPGSVRVDVPDPGTGLPSGKLLPVEGTVYDFAKDGGSPLGDLNLDSSFVHLRPAPLDNGPSVELRDPKSNYGLRIAAISSTIKAIHIYAPSDSQFVSIDPQFNFDDPFGREWAKDEDTGMVTLQPGESVQWKIRLEIFPLQTTDQDHF